MLSEIELSNINGGAIKWTIGLIAGTIFTLIAGIIDGLIKLK